MKDRVLLQKIFGELKTRYASRKGGYTRLMRGGFRRGDAADIAILELVDRVPEGAEPAEAAPAPATEAKAKRRRPEPSKAAASK